MHIFDRIRNDIKYIFIKEFSDKHHIPINIVKKMIGFGKYTDFYLYYIGEFSGRIEIRIRKVFNKELNNNLVVLSLDDSNLNKIEKALNDIYLNYKNNITEIPKIEKESINNKLQKVTNVSKTKKPNKLANYLLQIIDDAFGEDKVYVSTLKRILEGNTESNIALKYRSKEYFGSYREIKNFRIRKILIELLKDRKIIAHEGYKGYMHYTLFKDNEEADDIISDYNLAILKVMMEED